MRRTYCKFVLRAGVDPGNKQHFARVAGLLAIMLCAGLTACAEDTSYPSLAKISGVDHVMTPEERQKAVEDLQKQDQAHSSDAEKTASR